MTAAPESLRQAPEGGLMRRFLGPLHVTGVFWFRLHAWAMRVLPAWAIGAVLTVFTSVFFLLLRRIRQAIASNLAVVLGPAGFFERQRRIFRTLRNHAWCMSERYERHGTERRVQPTAEGIEHWDRLLAEGTGFILLTAHLGHWEVGSWVASSRRARHIHVVREREMDPRAQEFVEELMARQDEEGYSVHFVEDERKFGAKLLFALRRGEVVALQGDRPSAHGRAIEARLFGQPLELPAGPAILARAAGVPLLPVFVFRDGRQRSRVVFRDPIRVPATADRDADLGAAVERVAAEIEWAIRQRPFQWFCFRELWPRR